jgi:hypothetical protein
MILRMRRKISGIVMEFPMAIMVLSIIPLKKLAPKIVVKKRK